jgi:hypothetical protein
MLTGYTLAAAEKEAIIKTTIINSGLEAFVATKFNKIFSGNQPS